MSSPRTPGPGRGTGGARKPSPAQQRARERRKAKMRALWVRRVLSMLVVLAAIALVAFGLWKVFQIVRGAFDEQQQASDPRTVATPVTIAECTVQDLGLTMTGPAAIDHAAPADFQVSVTNRGKDSCSWDSGVIGMRVTSGEDVVYEMRVAGDAAAQSGATNEGVPLLFGAGESWATSLHWPGTRNLEGARPQSGAVGGHGVEGGPVAAGQYVAQLTIDGRTSGPVAVVTVNEPPPPEPAEGEEQPAPAEGEGEPAPVEGGNPPAEG